MKLMSGSLVLRNGVGTQMLMVSSSRTAEKSVVARSLPASTRGASVERHRHRRWSSDVCSSDLVLGLAQRSGDADVDGVQLQDRGKIGGGAEPARLHQGGERGETPAPSLEFRRLLFRSGPWSCATEWGRRC